MDETYFNLLPNEINELILFNLTPEEIYGVKTLFPYIDDNKFWYAKIQYDFPLVNMDFISPHFYSYKDKTYAYIKFEYDKLIVSYSSASDLIEQQNEDIKGYELHKKKDPYHEENRNRNEA